MSNVALQQSKKIADGLKKKLAPGPERGGFILRCGKIVEFDNTAPEPEQSYRLSLRVDQLEMLPDVAATWHTHPGATANLSVGDAETFIQWPDILHVVIGEGNLRWYAVKNGAVINA